MTPSVMWTMQYERKPPIATSEGFYSVPVARCMTPSVMWAVHVATQARCSAGLCRTSACCAVARAATTVGSYGLNDAVAQFSRWRSQISIKMSITLLKKAGGVRRSAVLRFAQQASCEVCKPHMAQRDGDEVRGARRLGPAAPVALALAAACTPCCRLSIFASGCGRSRICDGSTSASSGRLCWRLCCLFWLSALCWRPVIYCCGCCTAIIDGSDTLVAAVTDASASSSAAAGLQPLAGRLTGWNIGRTRLRRNRRQCHGC